MADTYRLTASEAKPLLESGELSCEAIIRATLTRIDQRNDQVLAWVVMDGDKAIARAQELDKLPKGPKRGLLHGVTLGIKDIILTAGKLIHPKIHFNNTLLTVDRFLGRFRFLDWIQLTHLQGVDSRN